MRFSVSLSSRIDTRGILESRDVKDDIKKRVDKFVIATKSTCPVSTPTPTSTSVPGVLRASIHAEYDSGHKVKIGSRVKYAAYNHYGNKEPYRIYVKNARALRFWWGRGPQGPKIYHYQSVLHPRVKGSFWLTRHTDILKDG